jgi:hypothetical protein
MLLARGDRAAAETVKSAVSNRAIEKLSKREIQSFEFRIESSNGETRIDKSSAFPDLPETASSIDKMGAHSMKTAKPCYRLETLALVAASMLAIAGGPACARDAEDRLRPAAVSTPVERTAPAVVAANELQGKICQASIQDQIEWDYRGSRHWAKGNLEKICRNAKFSLQPGVCFNRVMHGNINHGSGTRWHWRPALNLCAGTQNANATIKCFSDAVEAQTPWPRAIEQCRARP